MSTASFFFPLFPRPVAMAVGPDPGAPARIARNTGQRLVAQSPPWPRAFHLHGILDSVPNRQKATPHHTHDIPAAKP
ncbi:uncharacterized protein LY79DRAFT_564707 [Colletotrichum navitas]|uniref:Uncharacterized protein n=1 Tax=Colletotrichum navitas TaxID=681940 RepID=A0AAD8PRC6_9PEZI|nr:uncharacterized protein LY79DRAFT_564707 [Colletotrichum navitas]KAK1579221.1 hypothetical protein LY79DRAFT_564707 [Colletotrichum navitas]